VALCLEPLRVLSPRLLQGVQCKDCGYNAHKKCAEKVPKNCTGEIPHELLLADKQADSTEHESPSGDESDDDNNNASSSNASSSGVSSTAASAFNMASPGVGGGGGGASAFDSEVRVCAGIAL